MRILRGDFETRGAVELGGQKSVGLYNYATHPLTKTLLFAYEFPYNEDVQLWQYFEGPFPKDLMEAFKEIQDPTSDVYFSAFNSAFERYMLQYKHGIIIPATKIIDPQASARYATLPPSLEDAGAGLNLPTHLQKDKVGNQLIDLFSEQKTHKKKDGGGTYFNNEESHPYEWGLFGNYCKQDVRAEKEISRRLEIIGCLPLPEFERRVWVFDQRVNDRGMPADREFVEKALKLATRAKDEALERQNKLTGLESANSTTQLLPWVRARGYKFTTLRKETVEGVLKDKESNITEECREVLKARREAASTSYKKLAAILRQICDDGTIKNQFIYMGSSRCGRWSGNSVQLHNMARPNGVFEKTENIEAAREMIYKEDYDGLKTKFGSVLLTVKYLIRTVFVAGREL
jgi:DNA polymerase bacteriophage-type